jgi:sugar fermentation stimulation protein A
VRFERPLVEALFVRRENRFAAEVKVDGSTERAFIPNTARMEELLRPEHPVLLVERGHPGRATRWDLVAVELPHTLVAIDARVPNIVVGDALRAGEISQLRGYDSVRPEVTWGNSRFDFNLSNGTREALVEVKSCTLVDGQGRALFPDAPTVRGARHVSELSRAVSEGIGAAVVIVVQRSDGRLFAPNDRTDPAFGDALRAAAKAGVEVVVRRTEVTRRGVDLAGPVPVDLEALLPEVVGR